MTDLRFGSWGLGSAAILLISLSVLRQAHSQPPSPAEAVKALTAAEGLEVKLFAAEPMVKQPVTISFDDRGRLWVLQYVQYPNPNGLTPVEVDQYLRTRYDRLPEPPPHGPQGADTIAILEDTDGDGEADCSKVFVTGLNLASGMALAGGGVYVVQSPYLLFYPDRDRDDVPDGDPQVLLSGFGMEDAHAFANSLTWGPDGWLYGAQGSTATAEIRGIGFQQGIWRYHPPTDRFELFAEGGGNTWGIEFDRHGNLFAAGNTVEPFCHHVQGAYYVKGFGKHGPLHNPYAFGYFLPVQHHGYAGDSLTGGAVIYQGGIFPEPFHGACIAPNTRHSAMRWSRIQERGSTFSTHAAGDFVTSTDKWFRPVDSLVGPDGALYVADWCDYNISHSNPKDRSQWYDPSRDDGRIWRVVPAGTNPRPSDRLPLEDRSSQELVDLLAHPNDWYAREARRILTERPDPAVWPGLHETMFAASDDRLRLQALWALYASGGLTEPLALDLLRHPDAYVRAWTVRLLGDERTVTGSQQAVLVELAQSDPSVIVRSQLACTSKRLPGPQCLRIVAQLLRRDEDVDDVHLPLLLWWAIEDKAISDREQVLSLLNLVDTWNLPLVRTTIIERLARRYTAEGGDEGFGTCARLLEMAPGAEHVERLIAGMDQQLAGVRIDSVPMALETALQARLAGDKPSPSLVRLALRMGLAKAAPLALALIADREAPETERIASIETLGQLGHPEGVPALLALVRQPQSDAIYLAALSALARYQDDVVPAEMLPLYTALSPPVRSRLVEVLTSRHSWSACLLQAVEAGAIDPKQITLDQVRRILQHDAPELNALVEKHWGRITAATPREKQGRMTAISQILAQGTGDAAHGKQLAAKHCGTCHQLFGEGNKVGPDLTGADRKNLDVLLLNMVDPNAAVREQYAAHVAITTDGRVLTGLIAESTAETVTLLDDKNVRTTLNRDEIDQLEPSPVSLMPERILDPLSDQELRDLFRYLREE